MSIFNKSYNFVFKVKRPNGLDSNDNTIYEFICDSKGNDIIFIGKKTNAHGDEVYKDSALNARDTATIFMPYHPRINAECLVCQKNENMFLLGDQEEINTNTPLNGVGFDRVYEIIGTPDNIGDKNKYLEFKIRRFSSG